MQTADFVRSLYEADPVSINIQSYAEIVRNKSIQRRLINTCGEISQLCYDDNEKTEDILAETENRIFDILKKGTTAEFVPIDEIAIEVYNKIQQAVLSKDHITGLTTGFTDLDNMTTGFQPSDFILIAARPSMGKTAFVLNIAAHMAFHDHRRVAIFSLEMSKEQLGQRMLSSEARVDLKKLQRGKLESDDWKRINIALDELNKAKIFIDDSPEVSFAEIRNKCRRLKAEHGLDMVLVDYMQLMKSPERADNRQAEISAISRSLKLLAREMDCPVVALSQLSRGPEQRQDHHPNLADLRESGAIEQDADLVIFLYRDEYYNPDTTTKPGICEVDVAKNRHGETKKVELTWIDRYAKFSDKAM
jgi:replicative DNA helicase